jgi:hypothetical protein
MSGERSNRFGIVVSIVGILLLVSSIIAIGFEDAPDPSQISDWIVLAFATGILSIVIGLSFLLFGVIRKYLRLDSQAGGTVLSTWSDTFRSLNYSVAAGQSSYAPLIFFIYAFLGALWGQAIAERELPPRSDALLVLAAHVPHGLLLVIGVVHCRRRGSFFGMTLPWFLTFAAVGFVSALVLFLFI